MLSGIKRGKKKKQKTPDTSNANPKEDESNSSVADLLRESIATGKSLSTIALSNSKKPSASSEDVILVPDVSIKAAAIQKSEEDMTVEELLVAEKASMTPAEIASRNAFRVGKKRKLKKNTDSDEEERQHLQLLRQGNDEKSRRRQDARAISQYDHQTTQMRRCWWWLESGDFNNKSIMALGKHTTLTMAPARLSVTVGRHFFIVPIGHCESFTSASDEIWEEVVLFQNSLRKWASSQNQMVLFTETVFNKGFWQTKLECIFVDSEKGADAPLYFCSTLREQAQEWGTHQKLLKTDDKGLRRTIPPKFAYFYVEYDPPHRGYVQLIESDGFPKSFATDTICGMMGEEPLRMRMKSLASVENLVHEAQPLYSKYDWTSV